MKHLAQKPPSVIVITTTMATARNSFMLIGAGLGVFLGVAVQRSSGIGFGLICVPIFSLIYGGYQGVLLANTLSVAITFSIFISTRSGIDVRRLRLLVLGAMIGILPGVFATKVVPDALLTLFAGIVILSLIVALTYSRRRNFDDQGFRPSLAVRSGALSGFLSAASANGGPPLAIYANRSGWPAVNFVPTTQFLAFTVSLATVFLKGLPVLPISEFGALIACAGAGFVFGSYTAKRLASEWRIRIALYLASAAGAAAFVAGTWQIL